MPVEVTYLVNHPEVVPVLAQWLYDEWGHHFREDSVQRMVENLGERMNRDSLPLALVAMQGFEPVGTASLKIREMETHPQYEHWLGSVYVHGPHRGKGIGSLLVEAAAKEASRLGIEDLYLYTRNSESLYLRLGWVPVERPMFRGREAVIMKRVLVS